MSSRTKASLRYRGIRVISSCSHCGMPLPLLGPVLEARCAHCQEINTLSPDLWRELLDRVDCQPASVSVQGKYDVDVVEQPPPTELHETAFDAPQWLTDSVPSVRRCFGAAGLDSAEAASARLELEGRGAKPVVMSCPECAGSLRIGGDAPRTTTCQYCASEIYLPDDLWQRLHPVTKATRWYVEYAGENSEIRDRRLAGQWERMEQLRAEQKKVSGSYLNLSAVLFIAAVCCVPSGCVNCVVGIVAAGDPLFGLHARIVCPRVCDDCTPPYIPEGQSEGSVDTVYCSSPRGKQQVPVWILLFPGSMWLLWFVLLIPAVAVWAARRDRRSRRRLPEVKREIAALEEAMRG